MGCVDDGHEEEQIGDGDKPPRHVHHKSKHPRAIWDGKRIMRAGQGSVGSDWTLFLSSPCGELLVDDGLLLQLSFQQIQLRSHLLQLCIFCYIFHFHFAFLIVRHVFNRSFYPEQTGRHTFCVEIPHDGTNLVS